MCWAMSLWMALAAAPKEIPLWQLDPFDRITLANGDTHDIEPVRIDQGTVFDVQEDEYVGQKGLPPLREIISTARYLIRRIDDGQEYYVVGRHVRKFEYFEDLLLGEAKRFIREGRFDDAFPNIERLMRLAPEWPGLDKARVDYHFQEGIARRVSGDFDRSLVAYALADEINRTLEDSVALTPSVEEEVESLVGQWLGGIMSSRNYTEARRVIARVESLRPTCQAVQRTRSEIEKEASEKLEEARKAKSDKDWPAAQAAIEAAADADPSQPAIVGELEEISKSWGHLRVAVEALPFLAGGPAQWNPADWRAQTLAHLPMARLEGTGDDAKWSSQLIANISRPDASLNRRATLDLKPGVRWSRDGKPLTVIDVERFFADACRAGSENYHPALARLVVGLAPELPYRIHIDFERPQPRPEAWLTVPLLRSYDSNATAAYGLGPYVLAYRTNNEARFVRNEYFLTEGRPLTRQVTERSLPDPADRLRAFEKREVEIITDLPPKFVSKAQSLSGARVIRFAHPTVYFVQFNWQDRFLRDRTVRRAMAYAIDRSLILQKIGLEEGAEIAVPSAPWPKGSFGYDESILVRPHDLVLAKTLMTAAIKRLGSPGELRLQHGGSQTDQLVCEELARQLRLAGLNVSVVGLNAQTPTSPLTADLRYTRLAVRDPIQDTVTLLTRDNPSLSEYASPWLRRALVELTDLPNLSAARDLLPRLQRILHDDIVLLPLWQGYERLVVSDRVSGVPPEPDDVYSDVMNWSVRPAVPDPLWAAKEQEEQP